MKIEVLKQFGIDGSIEGKLIIDISSEWCGLLQIALPCLN